MLKTKTISSNELLFNLRDQSHKIIKINVPARRFNELESFRQSIEISQHLPFNMTKRKIFTYKAIFFAFSLLFLTLGATIMFKLPMLTYSRFLFIEGYVIKNLVGPITMMLGLASFWIGFRMCAEKEAAHHIFRNAKYNLSKAYARKKIEFGINGLLHFGHTFRNASSLKQSYVDAYDQLISQLHELYHLFDRIGQASQLNPRAREKLYNQSIMEFSDKAERTITNFNKVEVE